MLAYNKYRDPYSETNLIHGQPYEYLHKDDEKIAHQQWLDSLAPTRYLCPDCLERGNHKYLRLQNNQKYLCSQCNEEFATDNIINSYKGAIDAWRSDADWLEDMCKMLKEGNKKGI